MIRIDLSVRRVYLAAFSAIAYVLAHRSATSLDWPPSRALGAIASDAAALAVLFLLFSLLDRWLRPASLAARSHKALHFALALTTTALAAGAQVLYQKTGEILDLGIIEFFLMNFNGLTGATRSVLDYDVLLIAIACFGFYVLSLLHLHHRLLKSLQYLLFFSPMLVLALDFTHELLNSTEATYSAPHKKALYQGKYADHIATNLQWLDIQNQPVWHQGILSGLYTSSSFGSREYQNFAETVSAQEIYISPHTLSSPYRRPNLLFVLLESTRADAIGAYSSDGSKSHTPFLDALSDRAWLYERAYTTVPHTSKALVGIYCGTFAKSGTDDSESNTDSFPLNCLPRLLTSAGYQSAHFQTAPGSFEGRSQFLANAGFGHTVVQEDLNPKLQTKYGYLGLDDALLIEPMLAWMQEQHDASRPFFASMLTILTHHPYSSPNNVEPLQSPEQGERSYFLSLQYTDGLVKELIEAMKHRGLLDNTLIVITGDHGEGFSEHGQITHNGTSYEEGMHVPLIVYGPKLLPGARKIGGLRQHIDILPSLLNLIGSRHDGKFPGKDLFSDEKGHEEIITSCFYREYCLNHYQNDGTKMLYFFGKRPSEFFDLKADPMERKNLAPVIGPDQLKARLRRAATLRKTFDQLYAN